MLHLRAFCLCFPLSDTISGHNQWLMGTRLQSPGRLPFFMNCIFPPSLGSLCCFCSAIINLQILLKWVQTWWITNQRLLCIEISTGLDPIGSASSRSAIAIFRSDTDIHPIWTNGEKSLVRCICHTSPTEGTKSAAGAKHQTEIQLALVTGNLTWIPQLQRWKWPMGIGAMLQEVMFGCQRGPVDRADVFFAATASSSNLATPRMPDSSSLASLPRYKKWLYKP